MSKTPQAYRNPTIGQCVWAATTDSKRPSRPRNSLHIAVLLIILLAIGIYIIATTVLIAKDGTLYIECARQIRDNPVEAVRNMPICPGYPFLIYLMHKVTGLFNETESIQEWIISAQAVSLLSKVIASVALYFVGSYFVGPNLSFWGVLILSILPDSAKFGSDALTEWPHLMFLTTGFLLLLLGAQYRKSWMFGWAGIIAGLGYLVRVEGCQLILYGSAWLLFNLVRPQGKMKRTKAAGALILLLAGFAVIAIPYMRSKGCVFPDQGMWKLPAFLSFSNDSYSPIINANMCLAGLSIKGVIGNETLITNMCETLVYYFIPPLLIGCYYYFRKQSKTSEQTFFAAAFVIFNVVMLSWQSRGYLSRRHTLALVVFTIFYIPIGLNAIACWLSAKSPKNNVSMQKNRQRWFFILAAVGFSICTAKFGRITPLRWEKQGYLDTAKWLRENTSEKDLIAVGDSRIGFYAQRPSRIMDGEKIPGNATYVVKFLDGKQAEDSITFNREVQKRYSVWMNKKERKRRIVIYEVL